MRIDAVEIRQVTLPLVAPFRTATATERDRHVVLVRVLAGDIEGWGECAALTAPTYTSEYAAGAAEILVHHLAPALAGRDLDGAGVVPALAHVKGHPMAKSAIEMAVLDAELRHEGRSLAARLGATRERVTAGVAVGLASTIDDLVNEVSTLLAAGYRRVKLKIQPGWDVEPVRAVRNHAGAGVLLQVDANGSYADDDDPLARLAPLDEFDLTLIEQPLADDDLDGHAALAKQLATPICLDESITSVQSLRDALDARACSIVSIKAGRVGGYLEAVRMHDICVDSGVPVWCGGMLETGLAKAANLALAALPGFTVPGDLYASERWFGTDLTEPFVLEADGTLRVPEGPGIGVTPRSDVLTEHTDAVEIIRS